MSQLHDMSAVALVRMMRERTVSSREVTTAFLDRIEAVNPAYNAIVSLRDRDEILREAGQADAAIAAGGALGALHGLPIAVKDILMTKGLRTTYGSPLFADFIPERDSLAVARQREAGAILIGKTNTPEFGLGSHTFNPVFGATGNAYDPTRSAGGSSGGAAVALALRMLPLADGTDLGGSLRNPAAFNNVLGLRPSRGRVPGLPAQDMFYGQLSTEGPMARSIADLALLLNVQAGPDPRHPLALDGHIGETGADRLDPRDCRIAWLGDLGGHLPMEPGILDLCRSALTHFEDMGCIVEDVTPAIDFEALWQAFVVLRHYQVSTQLKPLYLDPAKRALLKHEAVWEVEHFLRLSADDIAKASQLRSAWFNVLTDLFTRFTFLVLPSSQVFPFPIDQRWPEEIAGRRMDSYHRWMEVVAPGTLSGCPILALPAGFHGPLPMGLQIIGRPRSEADLLAIGAHYEARTKWIDVQPEPVRRRETT